MNIQPPKIARAFLHWYCNEELVEEIEGDINEEFNQKVKSSGIRKASWHYIKQVIQFFRPFTLKKEKTNYTHINYIIMFGNYFKISLRNIANQKLFAFINILSLAIGLCCSILIYLFIQDEYSFDKMHEKGANIYRINKVSYNQSGDKVMVSPAQPMPFGRQIKQDLIEFEKSTRLEQRQGYIIDDNNFFSETFLFAEPEIFEIFSFNYLAGNKRAALNDKYSVVLSRDRALKYFGKTDAIGEEITIFYGGKNHLFTVSGVVEDIPRNSTVRFEVLLPFEFLASETSASNYRDYWRMAFLVVYTWIPEDVDLDQLRQKLPGIREQHYLEAKDPYSNSDHILSYELQPLWDVHFNQENGGVLTLSSNPKYSYILGAIAVSILIIGCFNFMLLSIGNSAKRSREIGLRKVIGGTRRQVVWQFLSEAILMSFIGFMLAILFTYLLIPIFNDLAGKSLEFANVFYPETIIGLLAITFLTGILAGSYPAFVISGIKITYSLQNKFKLGGSNYFTKSLITVQFILSIWLIIGALVMKSQIHFLNSKHLGFNKEHLLIIQRNNVPINKFYNHYKIRLVDNPRIVNISGTNPAFTHGGFSSDFEYKNETIPYNIFFVDANYIKTLEMKITSGRDFISGLSSDSTESIIVNEAFVKALGWDDPIGKPVLGLENAGYENPTIIGVVEDFNFRSLEYEVGPIWLALDSEDSFNELLIRINPDNISQTISELDAIWKEIASDIPFEYSFSDQDMTALYESEERWSSIVNYSSVLAVVVACLGLFGLMTLTTASMKKEISIRKVLGASLYNIVHILSRGYVSLILLAILFSIPASIIIMEKWLANFAYRIDLTWQYFFFASAIIVLIVMVTISYESLKSAFSNPVRGLRNE